MRHVPARVLFIEDEPAIRGSVTTALREAGYLVNSQADGVRLREIATAFRPDLAILDIMLPGPDGLSLAGRLRAGRSEEHTSELQSLRHLVCRLLLEKKKK